MENLWWTRATGECQVFDLITHGSLQGDYMWVCIGQWDSNALGGTEFLEAAHAGQKHAQELEDFRARQGGSVD